LETLIIAKRNERDFEFADGVQISDREIWEHTVPELLLLLVKRIVAFPAKLMGFRPFCLCLATWLLAEGLIKDWMWFCVLITMLFGLTGLGFLTRWHHEKTERSGKDE
jgi:formate hydrogenlyase subunit 3/multisubunit Na+/H+ antiporter MnhD subunit